MKNKYSMQKMFSIFCTLILLISCFSALSACSQQTLSSKEEAQIKQDLLALMELDNDYRETHNISPATIDEISVINYLGEYHGYIFVYLSCSLLPRTGVVRISDETYDQNELDIYYNYSDIQFGTIKDGSDSKEYGVFAYKAGKFYNTQYLYYNNKVTREQLATALTKHNNYAGNCRPAKVKYSDKLIDSIKQTYIEQFEYFRGDADTKATMDNIKIDKLYNIIDDCVVLSIFGDRTSKLTYSTVTINGKTFKTDNNILVFANGEIYDLKDAFEQGLLTTDEIDNLHQTYSPVFSL